MLPTRSEKTEAAYLKRADILIEQYLLECNVSDSCEFEPNGMVRWVIRKRQFLRPATWRQYRSSLVFHLEKIRDTGRDDPNVMDEAILMLKNAGSLVCINGKGAPQRTSSSKKRSITCKELQSIVSYLYEHKTRWSFVTSIWLQAAVLTGLRPSEWQFAQLELQAEGGYLFRVLNAKNTNGRANGEERTLMLGEMSHDQLKVIQTQIEIVGLIAKTTLWDRYYHECRNTLYRTTRAIWPNRMSYPTLYTGRHQFAANAKMAGLSTPEVAALLGHGSVETAGFHYGRRKSGQIGMTVTPSEGDVSRLTRTLPNVLKTKGR